MGRSTMAITGVMTPATTEFLAAVEETDWTTALRLVDEHWVEIWYAVDPADLRTIFTKAPPHLLATVRNANYVARVTGHGPIEDLVEPEAAPARNAPPGELARHIADLRLRGRPVQAMAYVGRAQALVSAQRGQLVDGSGGAAALWLVQAGLTAFLAGETATAKGMFLAALSPHRPDRFPFVIREATAKLALAHAVTGDITEAGQHNDRARALAASGSWVDALVDDTIWLTDYIRAVDTLDPRAEEMRQAKPSPIALLELWPIALTTQARHLALTGRGQQAESLCEAVAVTGLPPAGADGVFATAVADARMSIPLLGCPPGDRDDLTQSAAASLARALHLFTTGQYTAVLDIDPPAAGDVRTQWATALLRAQAKMARSRVDEGRRLLLATLRETLSRRTYSTLRYLTRETLESIRDTDEGATAAAIIDQHDLATVTVQAVLDAPLSGAEVAVLRLLRQGLTRGEMAEQLFLSVNTVKTQLSSAYRKLRVRTRTEALDTLARIGL